MLYLHFFCVISSEETEQEQKKQTFKECFKILKMENLSNPDENDDHQSPRSIDQNDQSAVETPVYSTMSIDSFVYPRTCSETTSGFSDQIDETNSFCSEASPCNWPVLTESKSSKCLSGLEMQSNECLVVQEISEPGTVVFSLSFFSVFFYCFF